MQKTDEFIIRRLTWKAEKYKLPTKFAFYYNDLSASLKEYLIHYIDSEKSGAPVLFFTKPTNEWTLICTRQVICNDNIKSISINISDIQQISSTAFDLGANGQSIDIRKARTKTEWDTIKVIDSKGNAYILHADKGSDLFSLWNILLMVKRLYD